MSDAPTTAEKGSISNADKMDERLVPTLGEVDHRKVLAPYVRLISCTAGTHGDHVWLWDLRFTQPRAMGLKVSDEFTVPLCRIHHRDVHSHGDELAWWERRAIDPLATSRMLWVSTRGINDKLEKPIVDSVGGR